MLVILAINFAMAIIGINAHHLSPTMVLEYMKFNTKATNRTCLTYRTYNLDNRVLPFLSLCYPTQQWNCEYLKSQGRSEVR